MLKKVFAYLIISLVLITPLVLMFSISHLLNKHLGIKPIGQVVSRY